MKNWLISGCASIALLSTFGVNEAFAQTNTIDDEIIVTGSRIKKKSQKDTTSPTVTLGQETFGNVGAKDIRDVIETLTINTGAQNNADVFTQNITVGTSNINLRGLGIASTLVLLNGRRQVGSAIQASDGVSFVDTSSLVPSIAIERLEILKDGASAIYGSEAVAGVANFITRDNFVGLEVQADYQIRATNGSQEDAQFAVIAGVEGDAGHLVLAASYFDRTILEGTELDFLVPLDNSSGAGNPGRFIVPAGGAVLPGGGLVVDPDCEVNGGLVVPGNCRLDFGGNQAFVPAETRIQVFAKHTYDFNDNLQSFLEVAFSQNRAERTTSPSFPTLFTFPTVSASNPGNPFGVDVRFIGRPLGSASPSERNFYTNDTFRAVGGFDASFGDVDFNVSLTHAINDFQVRQNDTIVRNYELALIGLGGDNCDVTANTPGANGCIFFNPFGSSHIGGSPPNSQEAIDYIIGQQVIDARSKTTIFDAYASKPLFAMNGGDAAIAIGVQLRDESLVQDFDDISNANGFSFLFGNPDFANSRSASAIFAELVLPVSEQFEIQVAGRYEKVGDLDTFDPKIAARYSFNDNITVRGSWSTSFRAPSLFQQGGTQTSFFQLNDNGNNTFISVRSRGTLALVPETSTAFNFGGSFAADNGFELNADFWNFDFEDVLTQESAQGIFNSDLNDPRLTRSGDPLTGTVALILADFVNAASVKTNGFDISAKMPFDTAMGRITPSVDATYVLNYDIIDPQLGAIEGAGNRNFNNFATSIPTLRATGSVAWASENDRHSVNLFARYHNAYKNDNKNDDQIDSNITFDAQYNLSLGELLGGDSNTILTVGALNIFDKDPSFLEGNGNYDSKVGDPRGRRIYARVKVGF
ncbi:MAG: TonB-dependent receptor [Robiginitomaculum sp.]|nr:TonB-dependent receptor [Robiginitomaculum sp.]